MIRDKRVDEIPDYLLTKEALDQGMISMDTTILDLYKKKVITRDTALDYAFDRKEMTERMRSIKG